MLVRASAVVAVNFSNSSDMTPVLMWIRVARNQKATHVPITFIH